MKIKNIKIPIFRGNIVLVQHNDWEKVRKHFKNPNLSDEWDAVVFMYEGSIVAVFGKNPSLDIIVHEVVHVTHHIFMNYGMKLDPENDESQAYIQGWVTRKFLKHLKRKKK